VDQFANPSGVRAHEEGTGLEIAEALGGRAMDAWLAGVGTGATLMGVALALRRRFPAMQVMAVEPARSPVLSKGEAGAHRIPGIGPAFVPAILRQELINRVVPVEDDEALAAAAALARDEGLFCGPSSGANVAAALRVAAQLGPGKTIVTVLPDNGERYLKAGLWAVGG